MQTSDPPLTYAVTVNNFGVKPANTIATCALHKSADAYAEIYPVESEEIKNQTYIDDALVAAPNHQAGIVKTSRLDEICDHAGMPNKGWTMSGDDKSEVAIGSGDSDADEERVLGISWMPKLDVFRFKISLSFKSVSSGDIHVSSLDELMNLQPEQLTRRALLSNIHRIFDPMGLLVPVLLESKLLMRELWKHKEIGWDDPIPCLLYTSPSPRDYAASRMPSSA